MADKKEIPFALLETLQEYTDEDHILSTKEIIMLLEENYGLELERRTLYANVDMLKNFGYKISTWQENGYGYYMEKHQFDKSEVLLLCNAIHSSHFISAKESRQMVDKLLDTLSLQQREEYKDQVYLPNPRKTNNNVLLDTLSMVSSAIRNRHPISFTYLKYDENKKLVPRREEPYVVEPRYIVYQDSRPYLITTSDHHDGFANYRIDRISDLKIDDRKFPVLRKTQDAYEYAKNMYYMFNDAQTTAVIRCEQRILDHVIDTFGTECMIIPVDKNHFDVHIRGCETGIILFAQQYLDAASILEPKSLQKEMIKRFKTALRSYQR
ncbi:MAG: WYL domain-containing protein [Solobacterium sp.]|nr:WYL domain-containing protein [Solobacterium sp.]